MSLYDTVISDLTAAMKQQDTQTVSTLRMIKAELLKLEKSGSDAVLTDEQVGAVLKKQAKQRNESIAAFEKGGREDLSAIEKAELEIIAKYLPEQMSEDEIRKVVTRVAQEIGAANFGQLMGAAMKELGADADGALVRKIAQEQFS